MEDCLLIWCTSWFNEMRQFGWQFIQCHSLPFCHIHEFQFSMHISPMELYLPALLYWRGGGGERNGAHRIARSIHTSEDNEAGRWNCPLTAIIVSFGGKSMENNNATSQNCSNTVERILCYGNCPETGWMFNPFLSSLSLLSQSVFRRCKTVVNAVDEEKQGRRWRKRQRRGSKRKRRRRRRGRRRKRRREENDILESIPSYILNLMESRWRRLTPHVERCC